MHSELLVVAQPGRLPRLESRGGLTARTTLPDTVHLVSAAATPLGGDTISVRVVVTAGARLRLRSVAATVALPGVRTRRSHAEFALEVAGVLDVDLEPTVVAGGAIHESAVLAAIEDAGELRMRERVQIGRTGEDGGLWAGSMHIDVKGQPLLRHRVELGAGTPGDDVLAAPRAFVSELRYPGTDSGAPAASGTALELAGGGVLTTWQGRRLTIG